MPDKRPTTADIMTSLGRIEQRVEDTHTLAVKTNGRVTELERKWERREGYEQRVKEERAAPVTVSTTVQSTDWNKLMLVTLGLLGTALGIIGAVVGTK